MDKSDLAVNYFDFLVYIGMPNPREFGQLDYEARTFLRFAYNKKMEELAAQQ